jgi:DNA replication protein DnaC
MSADTLEMMFREFCLPTMAARFAEMMQSAEAQNWGYRKLLLHLCEAEAADRRERKQERLLRESKLPSGKTLGNLAEGQLPAKVRRQLPTLLEGGFVERAENLLVFGLPGRGKTHFLCALGRELILRRGCTVYFTSTFKLVQQLLAAKKELRLDAALKKLDRIDAIILDDLGYVQQSREEMEVLFTFLAERYERRSVLVSSNLVFSKWDQIFKDPMTTAAAVDRVVHHAVILELPIPSYRAQAAKARSQAASVAEGPDLKSHVNGRLIETGRAHLGRSGSPHGSDGSPIVDPRPTVRDTNSARGCNTRKEEPDK